MSNRQLSKISAAVFGHIRSTRVGSVRMSKDPMGKRYAVSRYSFIVTGQTRDNAIVRRLTAIARLKELGWDIYVEDGLTIVSHRELPGGKAIIHPTDSTGQFHVGVS